MHKVFLLVAIAALFMGCEERESHIVVALHPDGGVSLTWVKGHHHGEARPCLAYRPDSKGHRAKFLLEQGIDATYDGWAEYNAEESWCTTTRTLKYSSISEWNEHYAYFDRNIMAEIRGEERADSGWYFLIPMVGSVASRSFDDGSISVSVQTEMAGAKHKEWAEGNSFHLNVSAPCDLVSADPKPLSMEGNTAIWKLDLNTEMPETLTVTTGKGCTGS